VSSFQQFNRNKTTKHPPLNKHNMKLWDKGFTIDKQIELFTVGNDREIDLHIAKYDVQASLAHAIMLESIGIISNNELKDLEKGLQELASDIERARL
jgi:argininosuccinate lyase